MMLQSTFSIDSLFQVFWDPAGGWYDEQHAGDKLHRQAASNHPAREGNIHRAGQHSRRDC